MFQKLTLGLALSAFMFSCTGCGEAKPTNVSENAEQSDIDEYKAMIAAEEAANAGSNASEAAPPK